MKKIFYHLLLTTSVISIGNAQENAPQRPSTTVPTHGEKAPVHGEKAPVHGEKAPVHGEKAPERPSTTTPSHHPGGTLPLKEDNSICPDELNMTYLEKLKNGGSITLGGHKFRVHDSQRKTFDDMLPHTLQIISKRKSIAHISEDKYSRRIISEIGGRVLTCKYSFRTAAKSKLGGEHTPFNIISDPVAEESKLLSGLHAHLEQEASKAGR